MGPSVKKEVFNSWYQFLLIKHNNFNEHVMVAVSSVTYAGDAPFMESSCRTWFMVHWGRFCKILEELAVYGWIVGSVRTGVTMMMLCVCLCVGGGFGLR